MPQPALLQELFERDVECIIRFFRCWPMPAHHLWLLLLLMLLIPLPQSELSGGGLTLAGWQLEPAVAQLCAATLCFAGLLLPLLLPPLLPAARSLGMCLSGMRSWRSSGPASRCAPLLTT